MDSTIDTGMPFLLIYELKSNTGSCGKIVLWWVWWRGCLDIDFGSTENSGKNQGLPPCPKSSWLMEALHFKEAEIMELFQVLHHLHFSILIFLGRKLAAFDKWSGHGWIAVNLSQAPMNVKLRRKTHRRWHGASNRSGRGGLFGFNKPRPVQL